MFTKTKSISSVFLFNTILIVSLSITVLSFFWIFHENSRYIKEVRVLSDEYIESQKAIVKDEVNRVLEYIQHERLHFDGDLKKLQSKLLDRIGRIRYKKNQYIVVNTFDGTILAHYKQKNIGKNMWNFTDRNGVKAVQEAIKVSKNENGGYVTYVGSIRPSTGKPGEKITYAKSIPDWEWVVLTGVYIDDIETIISNKKTELKNTLKSHSLKITTVILFLFVAIILVTRYFSKRIKKDFDIFTSFFDKSAVSNVKIDKNKLQIEEFILLSDSANHMVDERKQAEEKIKELNRTLEQRIEMRTRQLESANKELEAFSYSVSHDLRAPLRAIDSFARILFEDHADRLDQEGKRVLNVIGNNVQKMGHLIDDLFAFSRIDRKRLQTSQVDMNQLTDELIGELKADLGERIVDFNIKPLPDAKGDRAMLREVLLNLYSNALKFSGKRDKALIEISSRTEEHENIYYVRDNGVGFDMKYSHKLFKVFQRLHSTKEFEGTGIGLALVHRIVQKHRGQVWAEGEVGKGATFYFSLPKKGENNE